MYESYPFVLPFSEWSSASEVATKCRPCGSWWVLCRCIAALKESTMPCGVPVPMRWIYQQQKQEHWGREGHFPQLTAETADHWRTDGTDGRKLSAAPMK
ncbi:hypothetical protein Q5P01_012298 [Channa striata]|uniref:Uncharacterized protein n=1 Tax=Channa striata TaxID=64152 RepID=A0AA88MTC2_CHASR|nr:hypothetical protein Q5P01_012298 [Channa striata]